MECNNKCSEISIKVEKYLNKKEIKLWMNL